MTTRNVVLVSHKADPEVKRYRTKVVEPLDLLDAVKALPQGGVVGCTGLTRGWTDATKYLAWAERALAISDEFGDCTAVAHAKRAVCQRIDTLIFTSHLSRIATDAYPEKIAALRSCHLEIPLIVHDLIIGPRNRQEHDYASTDHELARHATELAGLFLGATAKAAERESVVLFGGPFTVLEKKRNADVQITIGGPAEPALFCDYFAQPWTMRVLLPADEEALCCPMVNFERATAIELAGLLQARRGSSGWYSYDHNLFDAFKRATGQ